MKTYLIIIILLLISTGIVSSQEPIVWSKSKTLDYTAPSIYPFNDYFISIQKSNNGLLSANRLYLKKVDYDLNSIITKKIRLKHNNKTIKYRQSILLNNEIYIISFGKDSLVGRKVISAIKLNKDNLEYEGRFIPLLKFKVGGAYIKNTLKELNESQDNIKPLYSSNNNDFLIKQSPSKNKILVMAFKPFKKNQKIVLKYNILNGKLKSLDLGEVALPFDKNSFLINDTQINDEGKIVMVVTGILFGKKSKGEKKYIITIDNSEITCVSVPFGNRIISNIALHINSKNQFTCYGLYATSKELFSSNGVFNLKITENYNPNQIIYNEFDASLIKDNWQNIGNIFSRKSNLLYYYFIKDIIEVDGNQNIIIADQVIRRGINFFNQRKSYNGIIGNKIIVMLDSQGKIKWSEKIKYHKNTAFDVDWDYKSYTINLSANNIELYYYENSRTFIQHTFDFNGVSNKKDISSKKKSGVKIYPNLMIKYDNSTFIMYGRKSFKQRFGILKL